MCLLSHCRRDFTRSMGYVNCNECKRHPDDTAHSKQQGKNSAAISTCGGAIGGWYKCLGRPLTNWTTNEDRMQIWKHDSVKLCLYETEESSFSRDDCVGVHIYIEEDPPPACGMAWNQTYQRKLVFLSLEAIGKSHFPGRATGVTDTRHTSRAHHAYSS